MRVFMIGYAVTANFLAFCAMVGFTLWITFSVYASAELHPLVMFVFLGVGTALATSWMALFPFLIPILSVFVLGTTLMREQGTVWQGMGALIALTSGIYLWAVVQVETDSLKARYWRSMWSNRSRLEKRMDGSVAPYTEPTGRWGWMAFYAPVLAPLIFIAIKLSESAPEKPEVDDSPESAMAAELAKRTGASKAVEKQQLEMQESVERALRTQEILDILNEIDPVAYHEVKGRGREGGLSYESYKAYKAAEQRLLYGKSDAKRN